MLDPGFVADCPYAPEVILLDEILEVDREAGRVVARMPTREDLPLTVHQRVHPVRHPLHVAAGVMVHLTGMLGYATPTSSSASARTTVGSASARTSRRPASGDWSPSGRRCGPNAGAPRCGACARTST